MSPAPFTHSTAPDVIPQEGAPEVADVGVHDVPQVSERLETVDAGGLGAAHVELEAANDELEAADVELGAAHVGALGAVSAEPDDDHVFLQIERYGTLSKATRVVGWVLRFVRNARGSSGRRDGELCSDELAAARIQLTAIPHYSAGEFC